MTMNKLPRELLEIPKGTNTSQSDNTDFMSQLEKTNTILAQYIATSDNCQKVIMRQELEESYFIDILSLLYDIQLPCPKHFSKNNTLIRQESVKGSHVSETDLRYILQHCYVHLGDLFRYQNLTKQAKFYYDWAVKINPTSGHAYNQLAILTSNSVSHSTITSSNFDRIIHMILLYDYACTCLNPFPATRINLEGILRHITDESVSELLTSSNIINEENGISYFGIAWLHVYTELRLRNNIQRCRQLQQRIVDWITDLVAKHSVFSKHKRTVDSTENKLWSLNLQQFTQSMVNTVCRGLISVSHDARIYKELISSDGPISFVLIFLCRMHQFVNVKENTKFDKSLNDSAPLKVPLALIIRNRLNYALTYSEVPKVLMQRCVKLDTKIRADKKYPVGFRDVITIEKAGENFRLIYDVKGRFYLHCIHADEAGNPCMITGGHNMGRIGIVTNSNSLNNKSFTIRQSFDVFLWTESYFHAVSRNDNWCQNQKESLTVRFDRTLHLLEHGPGTVIRSELFSIVSYFVLIFAALFMMLKFNNFTYSSDYTTKGKIMNLSALARHNMLRLLLKLSYISLILLKSFPISEANHLELQKIPPSWTIGKPNKIYYVIINFFKSLLQQQASPFLIISAKMWPHLDQIVLENDHCKFLSFIQKLCQHDSLKFSSDINRQQYQTLCLFTQGWIRSSHTQNYSY